jgi:hypothetical protein
MTVLNLPLFVYCVISDMFWPVLGHHQKNMPIQHRKLLLHVHLCNTRVINGMFHTFLQLKVTIGSVYAKHLAVRPMIKFSNVKVCNYNRLKEILGFFNINHSLYVNVIQSGNDSQGQVKTYKK